MFRVSFGLSSVDSIKSNNTLLSENRESILIWFSGMAESESFEARKRHENPQNDEFEEEEEEEDEEILDDEEEDEGASQLTEPHQLQLTENNKHYKGSFFLSFAFFYFSFLF